MARPAIVARVAAVMGTGNHGTTANGHDALAGKMLGDGVADIFLRAVHLHCREEPPVGKVRQALSLSADAGEFLYIVIPGRDIRVANGPRSEERRVGKGERA